MDEYSTLSIIVPCYNVAQHLPNFFQCIEKQWGEHDDYEVIFVNDGSTDSTLSLLRGFVARDPWHRALINQENQGVSAARNAGIEAARGEWIGFADSDDLIADGAYAYLMDNFLDEETDMVTFEFQTVDEGVPHDLSRHHGGRVVWSGNRYDRGEALVSVYACAYRRQTVNKLAVRFNTNIICSEDILFNAQLLASNIHTKCTNAKLYYYVQHRVSTVHTINHYRLLKLIESMLDVAEKVAALPPDYFYAQPTLNRLSFYIATQVLRSNMSVADAAKVAQRLMDVKAIPVQVYGLNQRLLRAVLLRPVIIPALRVLIYFRRKAKRIRHTLRALKKSPFKGLKRGKGYDL